MSEPESRGMGRRGDQVSCLACDTVILTLSEDYNDWITDGWAAMKLHTCVGLKPVPVVTLIPPPKPKETNSGPQFTGRESETGVRAAR